MTHLLTDALLTLTLNLYFHWNQQGRDETEGNWYLTEFRRQVDDGVVVELSIHRHGQDRRIAGEWVEGRGKWSIYAAQASAMAAAEAEGFW